MITSINEFKKHMESRNTNCKFVCWKKTVDGYPESTGCVIDGHDQIVKTVDSVFDAKTGEFSDEMSSAVTEYGISTEMFGDNQGFFSVSLLDVTPDEAVEKYKDDRKQVKRIRDYMTSEREAELIALFNKKNESVYHETYYCVAITSDYDVKKETAENDLAADAFVESLVVSYDKDTGAVFKPGYLYAFASTEGRWVDTITKDIIAALKAGKTNKEIKNEFHL
jgi:hypothetical protein